MWVVISGIEDPRGDARMRLFEEIIKEAGPCPLQLHRLAKIKWAILCLLEKYCDPSIYTSQPTIRPSIEGTNVTMSAGTAVNDVRASLDEITQKSKSGQGLAMELDISGVAQGPLTR